MRNILGTFYKPLIFVALLGFFYFVSGGMRHTEHDFFVPLAESFLHDTISIDRMEYPYHEMVSGDEIRSGIPQEPVDGSNGPFYVIFPPLPAVIMMPAVAIFGRDSNQSLVSSLLAAAGVYVAYLTLQELQFKQKTSWWITGLYAGGSMVWYHGAVGSAWYIAQITALFFVWLAILTTVRKGNWALVGLYLGLAYLARFPVILSIPFFIIYRWEEFVSGHTVHWKNLSRFVLSISICLSLSLLYNWARYHRLDNYGYYLLEHRVYNLANEYAHGSYDLSYLPRHLTAMLWSFPDIVRDFPYIVPNMHAMALWIVFPALFLVFLAPLSRNRIVQACLAAIIFILPSHLFHGGVGATQFGYRYALDYMPFLILIIAESARKKLLPVHKIFILAAIVVNTWGIYTLLGVR